jgi:hypothetical protein
LIKQYRSAKQQVGEGIVHGVDSGLDTTTNALGKTVTEKEVLDLPLNGRNFSQLGLLQTGVAPINAGLLIEGGSLRAGQSYVVNGQRPEANNFLLDGAQNVDRMDGGFAWRIPIDAIAEFRILSNTASAVLLWLLRGLPQPAGNYPGCFCADRGGA